MKTKIERSCLLFLALASFLPTTSSHAQNLVANPGFETGDFTGWTHGGQDTSDFVDGDFVHSGNFSAELGPFGADATLTQTLATAPGTHYDFSFWLADPFARTTPGMISRLPLMG